MVKIRYSKIKQTKAKIYITNQLLQKHPVCFSMSPVLLAKRLGIGFLSIYISANINKQLDCQLVDSFKLVALIFLNVFTRSATLCCCIIKAIRGAQTPLAMLKRETSSCNPCSWNSKYIKNYGLSRTNSISKSSFGPQNHRWCYWKECKGQDAIFQNFEKCNTLEVSKYSFRILLRTYFNFH